MTNNGIMGYLTTPGRIPRSFRLQMAYMLVDTGLLGEIYPG